MKEINIFFKSIFVVAILSLFFSFSSMVHHAIRVEAEELLLPSFIGLDSGNNYSNSNYLSNHPSSLYDDDAAYEYLLYYFEGLDENMGDNINTYCVYVALAMILSYYDSWYDDSIIPEIYESNETICCTNLTDIDNSDFCTQSPGIKSNIPTECYDDIYSDSEKTQNLISYSLTANDYMLELMDVIQWDGMVNENYLYYQVESSLDNVGIYDRFNIENAWGYDVSKSFVVSQLQNNVPVLMILGETGCFKHAVVAYAYDQDNDIIYYHNGYKIGNSQGYLTRSYIDFSSIYVNPIHSALSLTPKTPYLHRCSDNYSYYDLQNVEHSICPCVMDGYPNYSHSYCNGTIVITGIEHSFICSYCEHITIQSHSYQYDFNGIIPNGYHQKTCTFCNYSLLESHDFDYDQYDEDYHLHVCHCAYSELEEHNFVYLCMNGAWHLKVCCCSYNEPEGHDYLINGLPELNYCDLCEHPDYCDEMWIYFNWDFSLWTYEDWTNFINGSWEDLPTMDL